MNEIKQKEKTKAKHTTNNRIYLYIPSANLENRKNNSPIKAGGYSGTGHPYRAESVSVCLIS